MWEDTSSLDRRDLERADGRDEVGAAQPGVAVRENRQSDRDVGVRELARARRHVLAEEAAAPMGSLSLARQVNPYAPYLRNDGSLYADVAFQAPHHLF